MTTSGSRGGLLELVEPGAEYGRPGGGLGGFVHTLRRAADDADTST